MNVESFNKLSLRNRMDFLKTCKEVIFFDTVPLGSKHQKPVLGNFYCADGILVEVLWVVETNRVGNFISALAYNNYEECLIWERYIDQEFLIYLETIISEILDV